MSPKQLLSFATQAIENSWPFLVVGATGIGKTDIIHSAADAADVECMVSHPVISDPTDYKGLPGVVNGQAEFLPYGDLRRMIEATEPLFVFFDDLGQAADAVQKPLMQILRARRIGDRKISDYVRFGAATNRRQDKAGVTSILEPVKSRFATIVELVVTTEEWCHWALENDLPMEVVAFNRFRPGLMMDPGAPTNDIVNRPSPRTVANMAMLFAAGITDLEILGGSVGVGYATEFVGFTKVFQELPTTDEVKKDPKGAKVPTNPAALYAITTALAASATVHDAGKCITYFNRLADVFNIMGVRDLYRANPKIAQTREFVDWATKHQDVLM